MNIDNWFKPAILVLVVIFLFIFGLHTLKGRYISIGPDHIWVLDTFTGNVYDRYGKKNVKPIDKFDPNEFDPPTRLKPIAPKEVH